MSDTEVTITQSESKKWWRMEYKGRYELTDEEPGPEECRDFRKGIDHAIRQSAFEAKAHAKLLNGESSLREEPIR